MPGITATELARELNLSKGRISQYVGGGKLDGCFDGDGRQRRFDLAKCAAALGRKLDPGQMMGNGAATQKAIAVIGADLEPIAKKRAAAGAEKLPTDDDDGYKLARTQKAVEEARRMRRQNAEAEGTYVLASEVAQQTKQLVAQEIAEFESVLRDGARRIADEMGVDFKQVRAILIDMWRAHRGRRTKLLGESATVALATEAEEKADI